MKEIIPEKLSQIGDLTERRLLREIMNGLFTGLIDYQKHANEALEERVFNEIPDTGRKSTLYFAVCPRAAVDPIDDFLYPVFPEEASKPTFNLKEIKEGLANHEEIRLFTVFLECTYPQIRALLTSPRLYPGELVTTTRRHAVQIKLEPSPKYIREMERLYHVFQRNGIPWKTVNNPFAAKFFDICLSECEAELDPAAEIKELHFDLGDYEPYKRGDWILLWNIERLSLKTNGYPLPALDKVNFEHPIPIAAHGAVHEYLVDEDEQSVKYILRTDEELTVVAPVERGALWRLLKITQPGDTHPKYSFPVVSNRHKAGFINGFAGQQGRVIRTRGEIARLASSFETAADFELLDIAILERREGEKLTYDCNDFIIDDIRVANDKKVMRLQFKTTRPEDVLRYDLLSFIVSEVQQHFPEYECVGELV